MPRYYFNVDDQNSLPDDTGVELRGIAEAQIEAVRAAGSMLRDGAVGFWKERTWNLNVTDAAGGALFSLSLIAIDAALHKG